MKKLLLIFLFAWTTVYANLPPTTSKGNGETNFSTTFSTDYGTIPLTRAGTKITIGTIPLSAGGTGSTTKNFVDLTTGQTVGGAKVFTSDLTSTDLIFSDPNYSTLSTKKTLSQQMSTGVIDGALLAINANPALFNLSAQTLSFSDGSTSLDTPAVKFVNCPALTAQTVTFLASADSSYVSVAPNCSLVQSASFPTATQRRTNAFIGRLSHSNHTSLTAASDLPDLVVDSNSQLYDLFDAIGAFNVGGNVITPNGANLSFNRSGGVLFRRSSNYATNKQNPHTITTTAATPQSFLRATQTTINSTPFSVIDPGSYDVAGTVTAIPGANARATNKRVFIFSNGVVGIQYGQVFYANISDALAGLPNETFVVNPQATEGGVLIGIITCRKIATDLSLSTDCIISKVGRFDQSGVTAGAIATTTMQQGYDISVTPQITTSTLNGAIDFKRGTAADTDSVLRIQNGAGVATVDIKGNGEIKVENRISADNLPYTSNVMTNGDFEFNTFSTGWSCPTGTMTATTEALVAGSVYSGSKALKIVSTGAGVRCYQQVTANAAALKGGQLTLSIKVNSTDPLLQICNNVDSVLAASDANCVTVPVTTTGKPWQTVEIPFIGGSTSNVLVLKSATTTTQNIYADDARMRAGLPNAFGILGDVSNSAMITTTSGAVSNQNNKPLFSSCTAANGTVCLFAAANNFTVTPNCTATINQASSATAFISAASATGITITSITTNTGASLASQLVAVHCDKAGADYANAVSNAYISSNGNYGMRPYTPTLTNLGTGATSDCWEGRYGDSNVINCKITVGTSLPAAEPRISLPGGNLTQAFGSIRNAGGIWSRSASAQAKGGAALMEPSVGYILFGTNDLFSGNVASGQPKVTSTTAAMTAGDVIYYNAVVPIAGWLNSNLIVGSFAGVPSVPGATGKEVIYSGYVSDTGGVVSGDRGGMIAGSCVYASNRSTCTLAKTHTTKLNCRCNSGDTTSAANITCGYDFINSTTTSAIFWTAANAVQAQRSYNFSCDGVLP